jgi:hypothetical protein
MRLAVIIVLAYLAGGICYVWRDLAERNILRQKPYTWQYRKSGDLRFLILHAIGWIVGVLGNAHARGRFTTYELLPLAVFVGSGALLWIISN